MVCVSLEIFSCAHLPSVDLPQGGVWSLAHFTVLFFFFLEEWEGQRGRERDNPHSLHAQMPGSELSPVTEIQDPS